MQGKENKRLIMRILFPYLLGFLRDKGHKQAFLFVSFPREGKFPF